MTEILAVEQEQLIFRIMYKYKKKEQYKKKHTGALKRLLEEKKRKIKLKKQPFANTSQITFYTTIPSVDVT